jgi:hypothetical protein
VHGHEVKRVREGMSVFVTEYYCLPDTLDPRGPKGK